MTIKSIIFDFDYTLADSSPAVIDCVNYAFKKMKIKPVSDDSIKKTIGMSLHNTFFLLAKEKSMKRADIFRKFFKEMGDIVMADKTRIFKNVPGKLKELKEKNFKVGIVSTKFSFRISDILKRDNLDNYVDIVIGGDNVNKHKPDPQGLLEAISLLSTARNEAVYIGDSIIDAETAENAGVEFIASLTGVTLKDEFKNYRVLNFINDISELDF